MFSSGSQSAWRGASRFKTAQPALVWLFYVPLSLSIAAPTCALYITEQNIQFILFFHSFLSLAFGNAVNSFSYKENIWRVVSEWRKRVIWKHINPSVSIQMGFLSAKSLNKTSRCPSLPPWNRSGGAVLSRALAGSLIHLRDRGRQKRGAQSVVAFSLKGACGSAPVRCIVFAFRRFSAEIWGILTPTQFSDPLCTPSTRSCVE